MVCCDVNSGVNEWKKKYRRVSKQCDICIVNDKSTAYDEYKVSILVMRLRVIPIPLYQEPNPMTTDNAVKFAEPELSKKEHVLKPIEYQRKHFIFPLVALEVKDSQT